MSPSRLRPQPADPAFYEAVGKAVELSRRYQKLARRDLAREAGISYSYLSEIETGKRGPSAEALLGISRALNLAPSALLAEAESWLANAEAPLELPTAATDWRVPLSASTSLGASPLFEARGYDRKYGLPDLSWKSSVSYRARAMATPGSQGESDLGRAESLLSRARQLSPQARRALIDGLRGIEQDPDQAG